MILFCQSFIHVLAWKKDRLCDIVVMVPDYGSSGPGSIFGATRFSET
jgi:hypothetical protein